MNEDKGIDFIARHYREGVFDADSALRRIRPVRRRWTAARIAAVCAVMVVISATAAVLVNNSRHAVSPAPAESMQSPDAPASSATVRVIDFEDTPLPVVVDRIREVYGFEVGNLPEDADKYRLSLHYEGSAADLVETVNDILDTEMTVSE